MEKLRLFMSTAKTVQEWNSLRETAKGEFSQSEINALDGSGYIGEVLKQNN